MDSPKCGLCKKASSGMLLHNQMYKCPDCILLLLDELEPILKLAEKATRGEWELQDSNSWRRIGTVGGREGNVLCPTVEKDGHPDLNGGYENFRFIVAACNFFLRRTRP